MHACIESALFVLKFICHLTYKNIKYHKISKISVLRFKVQAESFGKVWEKVENMLLNPEGFFTSLHSHFFFKKMKLDTGRIHNICGLY